MSLRESRERASTLAPTRFHAVLCAGMQHTKNVNVGVPGKRSRSEHSSDLDVSKEVLQIIKTMDETKPSDAKEKAANVVEAEADVLVAEDQNIAMKTADLNVRMKLLEDAKALIKLYFEDIDTFITNLTNQNREGPETTKLYKDHLKKQLLTLPIENMGFYNLDYIIPDKNNIPVITSRSNTVTPPDPKMVTIVARADEVGSYELVDVKDKYGGSWKVGGSSKWYYDIPTTGDPQADGESFRLYTVEDDGDDSIYPVMSFGSV